MIVGAYGYWNGSFSSGAVFVSDLEGNNQITIMASDASNGDQFGKQVCINDTKILVGGYNINKVYIYDIDGTNEIILEKVGGGVFGVSIAMSNSNIIVGDYANNRAYIYDLDGTNEIEVSASDTVSSFGWDVGISDNNIIVSDYTNAENGVSSGAVYVYDLLGANELKIIASDGVTNDQFGGSIDISNEKIVIGAKIADINSLDGVGAAYIYNIDGTGENKITSSDYIEWDYFGEHVSINSSKIVVSSAHMGDYDHAGAVYVYELDGTSEIIIIPTDPAEYKFFGISTSINDTKILIGTGNHNGLYVYDAPVNRSVHQSKSIVASNSYTDNAISLISDSGIGKFIDSSISISSDDLALETDDGTANGNIALGDSAMRYVGSGTDKSICIGLEAGAGTDVNANNGARNVYLGAWAGQNTIEGGYNVCIGNLAGFRVGSGFTNIYIGSDAGYGNGGISSGSNNIGIGYRSLEDITAGEDNLCLGNLSGATITDGNNNIMINSSGVTTGSNNIAISTSLDATAERVLKIGNIITGSLEIGAESLEVNGTFTSDTFKVIGSSIGISSNGSALPNDNGFNHNVAVGTSAGNLLTTGGDNTFIGNETGKGGSAIDITGWSNTSIGAYSLQDITSGDKNTSIGFGAALNITGGNENTCLGTYAGQFITTGSGNVCIGNKAGSGLVTTESNKLYISNVASAALIEGDFVLETLSVNGALTVTGKLHLPGIPTTDPAVVGEVWNNAGVLTVSAG